MKLSRLWGMLLILVWLLSLNGAAMTNAAMTNAAATTTHAQAPFIDPNVDLSRLWQQVQATPQDFSIGCVPLNTPSQRVVYHGDEPFPLASVSKVLILIEYARRIASGAITQDEQVSIAALNRYNLPRTNAGAHELFLSLYPEDAEFISLWDVATEGMIQYSSNAATDYVLNRLAPVDWAGLFTLLDLNGTSEPHALTLIPLLMNNHETGRQTRNTLTGLSLTEAETWLDLYVNDALWRGAEIDYRAARRRSFPDWEVQAAILQTYTAVGTANDWLKVMSAIYNTTPNGALSEDVKWIARTALRWKDNAAISNSYFEYGSKLGFYSGGVLTLVAFGHPYQGEPVISVSFLRNLPRNLYNEFIRDDTLGNLAHWLNFNACGGLNNVLPPLTSVSPLPSS